MTSGRPHRSRSTCAAGLVRVSVILVLHSRDKALHVLDVPAAFASWTDAEPAVDGHVPDAVLVAVGVDGDVDEPLGPVDGADGDDPWRHRCSSSGSSMPGPVGPPHMSKPT